MNNKQNAKYAFYYLLSLVALIFVSISVGMIVYSIIDKTVPDALYIYYGNYDGQLKFAISALIIATPIFYFLSSLILRGLKKGDLEKDSGVRRWLTYFILLVSSVIILGTLISVINNFLSGELTSRFILKALTVFIISASSFSFYFYDIKREDLIKKDLVIRLFFIISLALVVAAFIAAFFFVESPKNARNRLLDEKVINNISNLENSVNSYYESYKKLPDNLEALKTGKNFYLDNFSLVDPETKQAIVYQKVSETEFKFCATFRTDSRKDSSGRDVATPYQVYPSSPGDKNHAAGYQCVPGNLWSVIKAEPATTTIVN
ncbi:MAG: DUF5671 domain-containing protein [Patescibacteria group bacterium]